MLLKALPVLPATVAHATTTVVTAALALLVRVVASVPALVKVAVVAATARPHLLRLQPLFNFVIRHSLIRHSRLWPFFPAE